MNKLLWGNNWKGISPIKSSKGKSDMNCIMSWACSYRNLEFKWLDHWGDCQTPLKGATPFFTAEMDAKKLYQTDSHHSAYSELKNDWPNNDGVKSERISG